MYLLSDVTFVTFMINAPEILSRVVKINEIPHTIPISNFTVHRLPYSSIIGYTCISIYKKSAKQTALLLNRYNENGVTLKGQNLS